MSASVCCDYVIFRLTNIVFLCTKQFKIFKNSINDYSTNIKTKTCSAPIEPSYTMRLETKNNPGLKRISAVSQQCYITKKNKTKNCCKDYQIN